MKKVANGFVLTEMRKLISSSEEYEFTCARTWSVIVNTVNRSLHDSIVEKELNEELKKNLSDCIKRLDSIIETKTNLAKFLNLLNEFATYANGFIGNCDRFKIMVPLHLFKKGSEELIIRQFNELSNEIKQLNGELENKQKRLEDILRNDVELKKDLKIYQNDIKRLEKLLP